MEAPDFSHFPYPPYRPVSQRDRRPGVAQQQHVKKPQVGEREIVRGEGRSGRRFGWQAAAALDPGGPHYGRDDQGEDRKPAGQLRQRDAAGAIADKAGRTPASC